MSIRYKDQIVANVSSSSSESLPIGAVIMWAGTEDTVPDGWHICNGEEGTIDLRDRFVLGAGTNEPGVTGGESGVTLTQEQMPPYYVLWYIQKIRQGASTPSGSVDKLSTEDITNIMEEKNNG